MKDRGLGRARCRDELRSGIRRRCRTFGVERALLRSCARSVERLIARASESWLLVLLLSRSRVGFRCFRGNESNLESNCQFGKVGACAEAGVKKRLFFQAGLGCPVRPLSRAEGPG
jgi:hypothetical protein